MSGPHKHHGPSTLLTEHLHLLTPETIQGPVLDLACGDGHNGVFLAVKGLPVVLADVSEEALRRAADLAQRSGVSVRLWQVDFEREGGEPLKQETFGAILVFRYLHRPLIPAIKRAIREGGILVYETYTTEQPRFGKPRNPDFLLRPGELRETFGEWEIIYDFEGIRSDPERAVAQIVCRKPAQV